ncbi:MAG: ABC transporter permease [Myxococcales bacterium]|nr:ABC transporter permease [Myxococcales bacterium]
MTPPPTTRRHGFASNILALAFREMMVMRHDRPFVAMITVQPIMMLLLFGFALTNEPANVPWALLDRSHSAASRRLAQEIEGTGYFLPPRSVASTAEGRALLERGAALALVAIPEHFARDALRGDPEIQVLLDGADPLSAARVGGILQEVAAAFDPGGRSLRERAATRPASTPGPIDLRRRFWFNATLADRKFLLATLGGMLLTNLCLSVSSLGLVGERESGTYEQTLSLPTTPVEFVLGKLLPHVGVSYAVLAIALLGAGIGFGFWPQGSWLALGLLTLPFVLASLSIGVFVSSLAKSSAQAIFLTVFFILPSFVLSGVLLPYQLMPDGVRQLGGLLPLRWYQIGLRRIVTRGGGLDDVLVPILALLAFFAVMLAVVRWRLKPRLG